MSSLMAKGGHGGPRRSLRAVRALALLALGLGLPGMAQAYVGPGAGFAVVGSLGILFVTFVLGLFALLTWPFRTVYRLVRSRQLRRPTGVKRVLILGLDGMCPKLATRWMREGYLPNLKKLAETGSFQPLASAVPPMSPVAWSSFATGVDPSKHNIFDFLNRDMKSYMPVLSSTDIRPPVRTIKFGSFEIPISKPMVRLMRKSRSFWRILGEHLVPCHILRVPITFPPEPLPNGALLSAMCVPDLRGTQGSFTFFTTDKARAEAFEGGTIIHLVPDAGGLFRTTIPGPADPLSRKHDTMQIPLTIAVDRTARKVKLTVGKERVELPERRFSDWVSLVFEASLGQKVRGIVRFRVMALEPDVELYMTAINFDPESPAMPISTPGFFAQYLARLNGPYATLGLAEDTWALNERIIDEETFLELAMLIHEEREAMWFNSLRKNTSGLNAIVFDATDRIQHMFYRYLVDGHPANPGKDTERHRNAVRDIYQRCDDLVGRTLKYVDDKTVLFVISDHGFAPFTRGINLNAWLMENGYLAAKNGSVGRYFDGVDWSRTRAYTFGLTGIYINLKGRDSRGTVARQGEHAALKAELIQKLSGLRDPQTGEAGILRVFDSEQIYHGPYRANGPDLVIGYNRSYRASWDAAVGSSAGGVFSDNTKGWGGDHCMDPMVVPGVIFSNRKLTSRFAALKDLGPTTLDLFGVPIPEQMSGIPLLNPASAGRRAHMVNAYFDDAVPPRPARRKNRPGLLLLLGALLAAGSLFQVGTAGAQAPQAATGKRVIVLGVDGLDHGMVSEWVESGHLPNFRRLRDRGTFLPLTTSMPPQSPVAWSNFMTGANSGEHAIFDFLHRNVDSYLPYSSMSEAKGAPEQVSFLGLKLPNRFRLPFSDYIIPLAGGSVENLRRGTPFWDILADHGVPSVIHRCPVVFPPIGRPGVTLLSGMGTPDMQGTNGTYAYYTNRPPANYRDATGGKVFPTDVVDGVARNLLYGPPNDFIDYDAIQRRTGRSVAYQDRKASIPFTVYVDAEHPVAKVVIDDQEILLQVGEFSPWIEVTFRLLPTPGFIRWAWHDLVSVQGLVRFYLKSTDPEFGLYVTPVQISPLHPAMPISYPPEYAAELAEAIGPYYTQGMPEDTKALEFDVFGNADFLRQLDIIVGEETRMADHELSRFREGVLFLYWSVIDQAGHVMWRTMKDQTQHPARVEELDEPFEDFYPSLYAEIDTYLGKVLDQYVDEDTYLIVLSDHGFSAWQRSFDLNRWLYDHGYLAVQEGKSLSSVEFYQGIDWNRTRAFALGINGLYVNQLGRERKGIVPPGPAKEELLREISAGLLEVVDPKTGLKPISKVFLREEIYSGPRATEGPDAQIGYVRGYRASDECAVGEITDSVLSDNVRRWSGDHCQDYRLVPGVLFTNFTVRRDDPALIDIAPTLLRIFGVPIPPEMTGKPIL